MPNNDVVLVTGSSRPIRTANQCHVGAARLYRVCVDTRDRRSQPEHGADLEELQRQVNLRLSSSSSM
jgi:hypothetical protein